MVLQKQNVPISLGAGVDTKTDKKKVAVGKLLSLENAVIRNSQEFCKRNGYRALDVRSMGGTTLGPGQSLAVFNDELLQYNAQRLYSYSPNAERWVDKGPCVSIVAKTEQRVANTYPQQRCDSAASSGNVIYAWQTTPTVASNGEVHCSIYDETNGVALISDFDVSGDNAGNPQVVAINGYFYVFYSVPATGNIKVVNFDAARPGNAGFLGTVISDLNATLQFFCVDVVGSMIMITYYNAAGGIWVAFFNAQGNTLTLQGGSMAPKRITTEGVDFCLNVVAGDPGYIYVFYGDSGLSALRCVVINPGGVVVITPFTIESGFIGGAATGAVMTSPAPLSVTALKVFTHISSPTTDVWDKVRVCDVLIEGGLATIHNHDDLMRSVGLWSKAFSQVDSAGVTQQYVGVVHPSAIQGAYFLLRADGVICARYQYTLADGLQADGFCTSVWSVNDSEFCFAITNRRQLTSENGSFYTLTGISKVSADFSDQGSFRAAQLGKNLHIAGGFLNMYDGQSVVEHGFHLYPEIYNLATAVGVGAIADGVYRFVAVFEWTDNFGQRHLSAASVPVSHTVSGGGGVAKIEAKVNCLALTAKTGDRSEVSISLYRTENAGAVFYRVTSLLHPTYNDRTVDYITFIDGTSDAALISNEILYTVGGTLDNWPAPACRSLAVFKNRLWLAGLENENDVWFSKEHVTDVPVEFAEDFHKNVDPTGAGGVQCLKPIDDKLLAFRKSNYLYTFGDGPNSTGQGGAFADFVEIASDVGCENPDSLVLLPAGVAMQTAKGIYLVEAQSLQAQYFGAAVAAYNAELVTSAVMSADDNQVRFTTEAGAVLVFDYEEGQWLTFTRLEAYGAVTWRGVHAVLRTDGAVYVEEAGYFKDNESPVRMRLETGWIALAGISGFARAYELRVLGQYKTPHKLKISIAYDFEDAYSQVDYFDPSDMLPVTAYGDDPTFGDSDVYGGDGTAFRFVLPLEQQKCESIKILLEETTTTSDAGSHEAFTISAFSLYAGIKQGPAKYRQTSKIGE